jgi:hypothetical protein
MILRGGFCREMSGYGDSEIVSRLMLIGFRRCATECFAMAGQRVLLRFVNC